MRPPSRLGFDKLSLGGNSACSIEYRAASAHLELVEGCRAA
ncbi:hypothetical protein NSU_0918 [Novosphingobium pentaromativorans US6-1]|uniref:Uncharacterized protein n=1 Tax=Novosphingobium pentaromativorans US6-1 TaxID=1088721 RepID=G6E996_9SPHN|nr:hypothetical protein NSU_0918 [Novosphingobium pentaromativorans US6-1]